MVTAVSVTLVRATNLKMASQEKEQPASHYRRWLRSLAAPELRKMASLGAVTSLVSH